MTAPQDRTGNAIWAASFLAAHIGQVAIDCGPATRAAPVKDYSPWPGILPAAVNRAAYPASLGLAPHTLDYYRRQFRPHQPKILEVDWPSPSPPVTPECAIVLHHGRRVELSPAALAHRAHRHTQRFRRPLRPRAQPSLRRPAHCTRLKLRKPRLKKPLPD